MRALHRIVPVMLPPVLEVALNVCFQVGFQLHAVIVPFFDGVEKHVEAVLVLEIVVERVEARNDFLEVVQNQAENDDAQEEDNDAEEPLGVTARGQVAEADGRECSECKVHEQCHGV